MKWVRGEELGRGSHGCVCKAIIERSSSERKHYVPSLVAVKSCLSEYSNTLLNEKRILERIGKCPEIVKCFGGERSFEKGNEWYNLFLEFAEGGTLADLADKQGGRLSEADIRRHTRTILRGLSVIHDNGFVHCDIKPHNILVFGDGAAKIADFGLSKHKSINPEKKKKHQQLRGTPMYMAPESVEEHEYEPPCDVWALGCVVAELSSGKPLWKLQHGESIWELLMRIAADDWLPVIPSQLSQQGRDFVSKCLIKDPTKRWTVSMLLNHAFVTDVHYSSPTLTRSWDFLDVSPPSSLYSLEYGYRDSGPPSSLLGTPPTSDSFTLLDMDPIASEDSSWVLLA